MSRNQGDAANPRARLRLTFGVVKRPLLFLLLTLSCAHAEPAPPEATAALMRAPSFCMGCAVAAGEVISGDEAFRTVLRRKTAAEDLQRVFERGNRAGRLYALAGLREIDRRRFEENIARFPAGFGSVRIVLTRNPSSVLYSSTASVVRHIRAGSYSGMVRAMRQPPRKWQRLPKLETREDIERYLRSERRSRR